MLTAGPYRPASAVQRGSFMFLSSCAGDPAMVERDPDVCGGVPLTPTVPVQPISYRSAFVLHVLSDCILLLQRCASVAARAERPAAPCLVDWRFARQLQRGSWASGSANDRAKPGCGMHTHAQATTRSFMVLR